MAGGVRHDYRAPPVGQGGACVGGRQTLVAMRRENLVVVIRVKLHEQTDLSEVVQAGNALSLLFGLSQRRQQHPGKDGDDGDDDEKFDEGKTQAKAASTGLHTGLIARTAGGCNDRELSVGCVPHGERRRR